jgi:hypothetical protein
MGDCHLPEAPSQLLVIQTQDSVVSIGVYRSTIERDKQELGGKQASPKVLSACSILSNRDFLRMAVFGPVAVDRCWSLTCVCAKLASAMQSIKCFCATGLRKTDGCPATFGAIQNRPVQNEPSEKVSSNPSGGRPGTSLAHGILKPAARLNGEGWQLQRVFLVANPHPAR